LGIGVTVVALLAIAGLTFAVTEGHGRSSAANLPLAPLSSLGAVRAPGPTGTVGPEGVPLPKARPLAPAGLPPVGGVDGIECQPHDQVLFHIHAHLTGSPTHANDGIIHIESPVQRTYTLGQFFDVWQQPLSPTRVGPAPGTGSDVSFALRLQKGHVVREVDRETVRLKSCARRGLPRAHEFRRSAMADVCRQSQSVTWRLGARPLRRCDRFPQSRPSASGQSLGPHASPSVLPIASSRSSSSSSGRAGSWLVATNLEELVPGEPVCQVQAQS
jgi:hypothetical protein